MFELIKDMAQAFGPSGYEDVIREDIKRRISGFVDSEYIDSLGNLIAVKKGSGKKIMLVAHMDEIGVMATHIDDKGYIRFSNIGDINPEFALGQAVRFQNGTRGIIFREEKIEESKKLKISDMYIDIGAFDKDEAGKIIKIGDAACFEGETTLQNKCIISKAMDDRAGCAILVKLIHELPETRNEIYFVFTVQEELGARGAKTAAYDIRPDMALSVDITHAGDVPKAVSNTVKLGKGPAIKIKDHSIISHPIVKNGLMETSEMNHVPYQLEVLSKGDTDAGAIHLTAGGIPSGGISIPCRYAHSPVEMIHIDDVENAVKLLSRYIMR